MATHFKAFITKYALTAGIYEIDAEDCFDISPTVILDSKSTDRTRFNVMVTYHSGDWHRSMEDAQVKAEAMRVAKIASLRKSIAKLEAKSFVQ